jgi:hypothetical protein
LLKEVSFEIHHLKRHASTPIKSEILPIIAKDMRKGDLGKDMTHNHACADIHTVQSIVMLDGINKTEFFCIDNSCL